MSKYQYTTKGFTKYLTGISTEQLTRADKARYLKRNKKLTEVPKVAFFDPAFKKAPPV